MLGMNRNTVVVTFTARADVLPATFLLLEVETRSIWKEEQGDEHAKETEPRHDVEYLLGGNVVVQNSCGQGTKFATCSRKTVRGGTDGCRIDLGCNEEGNTVGTELVEEGREEVHCLELANVGFGGIVLKVESRNDEEDEDHSEANQLHLLSAVEFVIDKECCKNVSHCIRPEEEREERSCVQAR